MKRDDPALVIGLLAVLAAFTAVSFLWISSFYYLDGFGVLVPRQGGCLLPCVDAVRSFFVSIGALPGWW